MGILNGSLSLSRYRTFGDRADRDRRANRTSIARLNGLLEPYKAGPVKLAGVQKDEQYGWVRPLGIDTVELPPDAEWDLSHCQVDGGFMLRLRIERRKVPAPLLQLIYKQRYFELAAKAGKTPGPKDRRELRDGTRTDLMGKALPALSFVDAYWREDRGELQVFTTGRKSCQLFEQIFNLTFADPLGLTLVRIDPPLLGASADLWTNSEIADRTLGRLSSATPATFAQMAHP